MVAVGALGVAAAPRPAPTQRHVLPARRQRDLPAIAHLARNAVGVRLTARKTPVLVFVEGRINQVGGTVVVRTALRRSAHCRPRGRVALRHRTLLASASNQVHVDIALGAMPFEERTVHRASPFEVGDGATITTCSAEDLIVHKAFAGRDKDWFDIRGVVVRQGGALDRELVWSELLPLLELREDQDTEPRLRQLLSTLQ